MLDALLPDCSDPLLVFSTPIVGPANQNGCIVLCVGNLADEKF
jgi:hypothetical protein